MLLANLPLLLVGSILCFIIFSEDIRSKVVDKLKLALCMISILLFILFFISIKNNINISYRY
ncbi:hypothetical protein SAMN04487935_3078 [Flavobacterium noncentrifugens]|uniref:Uncharacterized protein n=1 Tax=Flavobacterium noncentrifugens TaxID=1128970 RepID=A0A1G9AY21_9FLAO|nr:hypothetical protein SAMN04487935_3078 [Flavobacterium noncentrifugens]